MPSATLVSVASKMLECGVVVEVHRYQRRLVVGEDALQLPSAAAFEHAVDFVHGRRALGDEAQIHQRNIDGRHADGITVELARSSGITRPTAAAAPVLVGIIDCVAERARRRSS